MYFEYTCTAIQTLNMNNYFKLYAINFTQTIEISVTMGYDIHEDYLLIVAKTIYVLECRCNLGGL